MNSIRTRIAVNFILVIIITVLTLELFIINIVKENYYKNLEENLFNQVKISSELYDKYFSDTTLQNNVLNNVDTFWKQTTAQVQIIDNSGRILMDSIGVVPDESFEAEDVKRALKGERGVWIGNVDYDRVKVMSVSYPLRAKGVSVGVLRFITSLREINRDIRIITSVFIYIGIVAVLFSAVISLIISNAIVGRPLKEVTAVAKEMASGNFETRGKKKSDDEIGKLADTLNYMADEIKKRDQLKNDFISSVSHELRTPLTSIKGWAVTLKSGGVDDRELLQDGLEIIEKESDRLTLMVEELLDFSKFVSGQISIISESTDIAEVIKDIKKQLMPRARRDSIDFQVNYGKGLPVIKTDKNRLKQVFINILDNSFRFTDRGGKVVLSAEYKEGKMIFSIKDTGCGIESEELPRVKEKFYKGKNSNSRNGIGLSICDEIIKLMEGSFEIKSVAGLGTEMIIILPAQKG